MMQKYGMVLTNFDNNELLLNECVLTMMRHVVGECHQLHALIQLPIIESFIRIWETSGAEHLSEVRALLRLLKKCFK